MKAFNPVSILSPSRGANGWHARSLFDSSRWGAAILLLVVSAMMMGIVGATVPPNSVALEWDANEEPDVAGYKLYYGPASGIYTRSLDAGNATSVAVPDMISNYTYFFVVRAYNSAGLESPNSTEVSYTVPPPADLGVEYIARTALPATLPLVPEMRAGQPRADGIFAFTVTAFARTAVTISASSDLQTWEPLATVTNPTGGLTISDLESRQHPHRFYQIKLVDTSGLSVPD